MRTRGAAVLSSPLLLVSSVLSLLLVISCGRGGNGGEENQARLPETESRREPPPLPTNDPIEPIGPLRSRTAMVTDSWKPGLVEMAALIDREGPTLLVANVKVAGSTWQIKGPYSIVRFPASGSVRLKLADNQWEAVKAAKKLAIQPMPKAADPASSAQPSLGSEADAPADEN